MVTHQIAMHGIQEDQELQNIRIVSQIVQCFLPIIKINVASILCCIFLTHFNPMFRFYIPWKHQKTFSFLPFSGDIKMEHWAKIG